MGRSLTLSLFPSSSLLYTLFPLPHYNISLLNWVTARSIHTYVGTDDDEQDEQRVERVCCCCCCYSTSAAAETVEAKAATTPAATAVGHLLSICVLVSLSASTAALCWPISSLYFCHIWSFISQNKVRCFLLSAKVFRKLALYGRTAGGASGWRSQAPLALRLSSFVACPASLCLVPSPVTTQCLVPCLSAPCPCSASVLCLVLPLNWLRLGSHPVCVCVTSALASAAY